MAQLEMSRESATGSKRQLFPKGALVALAKPLMVLAGLLIVMPQVIASGQVLHKFTGGVDGATPLSSLIPDQAGNFYGTTYHGGQGSCSDDFGVGCGTIFKLTSTPKGWTESVLYSFKGAPDGANPVGNLLLDRSGTLYGTTVSGGANACPTNGGCGVVFKLSHSHGGWVETVLYNFKSTEDGNTPQGGLTFDSAGNLYGATYSDGYDGYGTIFELSHNKASWSETLLHVFSGADGSQPNSGLIFDNSGSLYGTTQFANGLPGAVGNVFELSPSQGGWTLSVLHDFVGGATDGYLPVAGVIFDKIGNLFGTTQTGGTGPCAYFGSGCGVVFELTHNPDGTWAETLLHDFQGPPADGLGPGSISLDAASNILGTTFWGGSSNGGTVFQLVPTPGGTWDEHILEVLGGDSGSHPWGAPNVDNYGNVYAMTETGGGTGCTGDNGPGCGTIFEIHPTPSLVFPVKQDPQCGGPCTPQNAPINTVFDHDMAVAYECTPDTGGYMGMTAFTGETASVKYPGFKTGAEKCKNQLFGYTNPNIADFLQGYNYSGGGVLFYDGHPGYDYNFAFGMALYPAINGCVTYLKGAAGVPNGETGHVLAIVPYSTEPVGGCRGAANPSGYRIVYMHLASYYDKSGGQVLQCTSSDRKGTECNAGQDIAPCPTCAQQDEWVSTDRANPIGYSGNFFGSPTKGWGGVGAHLHFEVDQVVGPTPQGVDPYGWCGSPQTDPYTTFTGLTNVTLWSGFSLICP